MACQLRMPRAAVRPLVVGALALWSFSCLPKGDLDAAARGKSDSEGGSSGGLAGAAGRSASGAGGSDTAPGAGGVSGTSGGGPGFAGAGAAASAGGSSGGAGSGGALSNAGQSASAGSSEAGESGAPQLEPLSDLPPSLNGSPVAGDVTFSADASWEVNGVSEPAFQVQTPTASYFLVKKLGMIVSMVDRFRESSQEWIGYSDGFRPKRGLPRLGGCCQADAEAVLATTLDPDSLSRSHVRLHSESAERTWSMVWDFYQTHVTLTVNRAGPDFSFQYRGVPGGALDASDRVVLPDGASYAALDGYMKMPLSGSLQWAYVADETLGSALFLVQHAGDSLPDTYSVADADTAVLTFGDARLMPPLRFSFGVVNSSALESVRARIDFIASVTPPD